jgi:hypothetical protein
MLSLAFSNITSRFQSALTMDSQSCVSGSSRGQVESVDRSAVYLFVRKWLDNLGSDAEHQNSEEQPLPMPDLDASFNPADAGEGEEDVPLPNKCDYTKTVFESVAYRWLIASLKKELSLAPIPGQEGICNAIYSNVLRRLEVGRKAVSSKRGSETFTIHLEADWNPTAFLRRQFSGSTEPLSQLLAKTITLTGSATDAQALPCEMYIHQTWPVSGPCLLPILKRALSSRGGAEGKKACGQHVERHGNAESD